MFNEDPFGNQTESGDQIGDGLRPYFLPLTVQEDMHGCVFRRHSELRRPSLSTPARDRARAAARRLRGANVHPRWQIASASSPSAGSSAANRMMQASFALAV